MASILIVDDSDVERRLAAGLLRPVSDLRIEFAEHGREALDILQRSLPDLLLTDLVMPEMDGLELVKAVRWRYPEMPIVLMTAYGNEEIAAEALRQGAVSYVPKAQQGDRLRDTVERILARMAAERSGESLLRSLQQMQCSFVLASDPAVVPPLLDFVQQSLSGIPLTDCAGRVRLAVALEEALLNAIYHGSLAISPEEMAAARADRTGEQMAHLISRRSPLGGERTIVVELDLSMFGAKCVIRDPGGGFDPVVVAGKATGPFEDGRNRGLTLIQNLVDASSYNDQGNEVTLVKHRDVRVVKNDHG